MQCAELDCRAFDRGVAGTYGTEAEGEALNRTAAQSG